MATREFRGLSYIDFPSEYCLVDIETTGLSPDIDEIIEIGAIKYSRGEMTEQFATLVKPRVPIGEFITNLTGITDEMLKKAPPPRKAIKAFADFLGDSIIVGYNVSFDVNFLYDGFMKHLKRPLTNNFIDVLRLSKRLCADSPSRELDYVLAHFDIKVDARHRGISDCMATQQVYEKLQAEALKEFATLEEFSKTFKSYAPKKPKKSEVLPSELLEGWKQELYSCTSLSKAFKFFDGLKLKKAQLLEFADYIGADVHKTSTKDSLIRQIVRLTVGEELYKAKAANNEDYTVTPVIAPPQAPASGSGSFSQMNAVALKIEAEKKSAPEVKTDKQPSLILKILKYISCALMLFVSVFFLLCSLAYERTGKAILCFPAAFFIAGCLVMNAATPNAKILKVPASNIFYTEH